ncbi:hypothetical protein YC2023_012834 [Brassica napus]
MNHLLAYFVVSLITLYSIMSQFRLGLSFMRFKIDIKSSKRVHVGLEIQANQRLTFWHVTYFFGLNRIKIYVSERKLLNLLKKKLRVSFKGNKKDATEFLEEMNEKEATEMKEIMGLKGNGVLCVYPREKNIKNMLSISKEKKKEHQRNQVFSEQTHLPMVPEGKDESEKEAVADKIDKSWLRISLASPKLRESISASNDFSVKKIATYMIEFCCTPMKGLYYCVIYLRPGDYHRIHSPADWNALVRRHFAEQVVLEGIWKQGFMALDVDGATNIGSIEEQVYDPQGHGVKLENGKEVGVFNMGSTVAVQAVPQITDSVSNYVESSNTTPQAAWQIAQPPASGTNPMDGATKGMDVDQPTPPSFGDEEKSLKRPWSDCWKYYNSSFPPSFLFLHYKLYAITLFHLTQIHLICSTTVRQIIPKKTSKDRHRSNDRHLQGFFK